MPEAANLLAAERSPYLLQHAANPVHWRPWGRAVLAEAQATNKPILLSIGYAACHWCHVMAHESFEDVATAELMNQLFVNVKVDREERPDIDHLYMSALQAMGQQGGWPLTMFLAPDGTPFWGGTYFPPAPRHGMPGFPQVLGAVSQAWTEGHASIAQNRAALGQAMERMARSQPGPLPGPDLLRQVEDAYNGMIDADQGGLQGVPKFPNPPIFRFLWQEAMHGGGAAGIAAVHGLLRAISLGGIYDHLGGGYARYSVDGEWLVPHFEKMLYDNGQILELLALAHAHRPDPLYAARAAETVGWLQRDMATGPDNQVFAASEDADSEGEEGRFYVWTSEEIDRLLGEDAPAFRAAYDVTPHGNWEDHTILRRITAPGTAEAEARLAENRATLLAVRARRVRPGHDDKVLADWNGLAILGLVRAGLVFARPDWIALAATAFDALHSLLAAEDGRLGHAWRDGHITAAGLLDDQAAMALAALALFEATGAPARLDQAIRLVRAAQAGFGDEDGSFFTSAADATDIPAARPRNAADNATPSGNGMIASAFARLYHLTGEPEWRVAAEAVIMAFGGAGQRLSGMPGLLAATRLLQDGISVVVAGAPDNPVTAALLGAALAAPDPGICVQRALPGQTLPVLHPAYGKPAEGAPAAYVCRAGICSPPANDIESLVRMLQNGTA
jgi:uncharacterized protein YyaL (SSP411 family)